VYSLSDGSRVEDALTAAGGLGSDADTDLFAKTFNRATKLTDGAKVYVPSITESSTNEMSHNISTTQNGMVNINTASESELDALPGVGPVTAQKIIDNRPYQTLDDLVAKKAIGPALFTKLKDSLSL
jgi:competence protein ComEA